MNITILYSIPSKRSRRSTFLAADEDTVSSAQKVQNGLTRPGVHTTLVGLSEDRIVPTISAIRADCIINLIDWTGEDLPLSFAAMEALESCGIPFAGATRENFALVDKVTMKRALDAAGLPTPRWQLFKTGEEAISRSLAYPVLVKLSREHCSVGLDTSSFVMDRQTLAQVVKEKLRRFRQDVYVEEFLTGREFQITVIEEEQGPVMLPPAEIIYRESGNPEFLTFIERWDQNAPEYARSTTKLAQLTPREYRMFEECACSAFARLGFRDFTRVDARLNAVGELMILEINPNPGLDSDPEYSMTLSAEAAGISFPDFLWRIVSSCMRHASRTSPHPA